MSIPSFPPRRRAFVKQLAQVFLTGVSPLATAASAAPSPTARVAVFSQPGFPAHSVVQMPSPGAISARLQDLEIDAITVDADQLSDPERFNIRQFVVLVLAYGNTYPRAAFDNLQTFHRDGGCFVLTGVPFNRRVVYNKQSNQWEDVGYHAEDAGFGPNGIGVGTFLGPISDAKPLAVAPDDLLGLRPLNLDWSANANVFHLDTNSVPEEDTIIPVIGTRKRPVAAIIVHHAPEYRGAVDLWAHRGPDGEKAAFGAGQVIVRGVITILTFKGRLTPTQQKAAHAALDRLAGVMPIKAAGQRDGKPPAAPRRGR